MKRVPPHSDWMLIARMTVVLIIVLVIIRTATQWVDTTYQGPSQLHHERAHERTINGP